MRAVVRARVRRSTLPDHHWFWWSKCLCPTSNRRGGLAPTQPEALAAALRHLATHHPKEDQ